MKTHYLHSDSLMDMNGSFPDNPTESFEIGNEELIQHPLFFTENQSEGESFLIA